jgi:hypothetical protein
VPLVTTWRGPKGAPPPALRLHHALFPLRDAADAADKEEAELAAAVAQAAAQAAAAAHRTALRAAQDARAQLAELLTSEQGGADHSGSAPFEDDAPRGDYAAIPYDNAPPSSDGDVPMASPRAATSSSAAPTSDGAELRVFRLSLRVTSLRPGDLPLPAAAVRVRAALPPALLAVMCSAAGGDSAPPHLSAPLRSGAASAAARSGAEVPLRGCAAAWRFAARVGDLAAALAAGPRAVAELVAESPSSDAEADGDEYAEQQVSALLGSASAPLAPLLQSPWVDAYCPVQEPRRTAGAASSGGMRRSVGALRIVAGLEDLGPCAGGSEGASADVAQAALRRWDGHEAEAGLGSGAAGAPPTPSRRPKRNRGQNEGGAGGGNADDDDVSGAPLGSLVESAMRGAPEYAAAWDLELWRAGEQASWRRELAAATDRALADCRGEWARREAGRAAEAAAAAADVAALEARLRRALGACEAREKALVTAAEAAAAAREAGARELAARLGEANAAVRSLRDECTAAVAAERRRSADTAKAAKAETQRADAAEAKARAAADELDAFRAAQRATPEGAAAADAAAARAERDDALRRLAAANAGRERALAAVRRLGAQLAQVASLRDAEAESAAAEARRAHEARNAAAAADAAAAAAAADRAAAEALADELAALSREAAAGPPRPQATAWHAGADYTGELGDDSDAEAAEAAAVDAEVARRLAEAREMSGGLRPASAVTSSHYSDAATSPQPPDAPEVAAAHAAAAALEASYGEGSPASAVAAVLARGGDADGEAARLLRTRAQLLASGAYTRQHALLRRCEACIEELWRIAEEKTALGLQS